MAAAADEQQIASVFLRELGAPDTPAMRTAVIAWLRKESGSRVIGNNPWNISLGASRNLGIIPSGERTHSQTGQRFAVYSSLTDGTRAAAALLLSGARRGDRRNYQAVVTGAQSGDPIAFLNGLASSAWSADRYGGPEHNSLIGIFNRLSGKRAGGPQRGGASSGGALSQTPTLGAFGDLVKFPVGHIVTTADVDTMMATLQQAGLVTPGGGGMNRYIYDRTKQLLSSAIGKPWTKDTQDQLAGNFDKAAKSATTDLLGPLGPIAAIAGDVTDPGWWARVLALLAGVGLVGFGIVRLATR